MVIYYYDSAAKVWNIADDLYSPSKTETKKTELEFLEHKKKSDLLYKKEQKRGECQATILAKYSLTDQANLERATSRITGLCFFEQRQPTKSELVELRAARECDTFINSVLAEFRTNGADSDFSSFV